MSVYRRALLYFSPLLGETILGTVLMLVGIGFNLLKPWPLAIIINEILTPGNAQRATPFSSTGSAPMTPRR